METLHFLHCFDLHSRSLACMVKVGVKLYAYNIRAARVERVRHTHIKIVLARDVNGPQTLQLPGVFDSLITEFRSLFGSQ